MGDGFHLMGISAKDAVECLKNLGGLAYAADYSTNYTDKSIMHIATMTEVDAGTDEVKAVTPLKLNELSITDRCGYCDTKVVADKIRCESCGAPY